MKKHESFLRKSKLNKESSRSLSSLNDLKYEENESEEFDMINWLKEIGLNVDDDLEKNLNEFPMTSIRNVNKRYQDTITRRLSTIKNRKIKRKSERADVRDIFKINDLSTENNDQTLSVSSSVEKLSTDDKNAVEIQKRNLSLPIIDLDKEKEIEKSSKFKSTSVNQLDKVKKELDDNKLIKRISTKPKTESDYLDKKQDKMHLDWSNKMKILYNLKDQLPTKNNTKNYDLNRHKFKSGESIYEEIVEPKINKRRSSWWFNSDKRKDSAVEIISLTQHSIKDSQIQHFVCHLSDHSSDNLTCGSFQESNKTDINQNFINSNDKSSENLDEDGFVDVQPNFDTCFQVLEDEDENGLKIVKLINGFKSIDYIDQLSLIEQHKLRQYLMLELTLLLDMNGFKCEKLMSKHKIRQKFFSKNKKQTAQKNLLFGESLDELLNKDQNRLEWKLKIPIIFKILIDYIRFNGLESEGIFRIPASNLRIQNLNDELKKLYSSHFSHSLGNEEISNNNLISFVFELLNQFSIYDVVAIFKQLIRELPDPLLNFNLQEIFLIVPEIQNFTHKIQILNLLILLLNSTHRSTLKEIINLLKDVSKNKELNKMSLSNIALIVAPTLFSCPLTNEKKDKQIARTKNSCEVTKLIINYNEILFNVPDFIVNQLDNTTNF